MVNWGYFTLLIGVMHSLKLTVRTSKNRPGLPKRKLPRIPTIHFQVGACHVSFREVFVAHLANSVKPRNGPSLKLRRPSRRPNEINRILATGGREVVGKLA